MSDFETISRVLANWPNAEALAKPLETKSCERLRQALDEVQAHPNAVGAGDLVGLIYHVLRHEELSAGGPIALTVPSMDGWPSADEWRGASCSVLPGNAQNTFLISSSCWAPEWLDGAQEQPFLRDAFKLLPRRHNQSVEADPMVPAELGEKFSHYTCPGQRAAIRSVFFSKSDATLLINLPTGAGKSLAAWAPALTQNGLTIVVVPTIALALDQEQQIEGLLSKSAAGAGGPFAWHSGLAEEDKEVIKRRVRAGDQKILFTSPESLVGGLAPALYRAAVSGRIRNFVVDEAHLIAQWGNEFRPEFQAMAGLRRDLLRKSPDGAKFRTILLTATLTEESYATIATLFGPTRKIQMVSATHLRPEPSYWVHQARDEADREEKLLELVRHLPRPFIIYASTPDDVERWASLLSDNGHNRLATVHGGTPPRERLRVVVDWKKGLIDGVIATSAFGLGMDQSDVRAVVHVCIPETVDRFYQEVGRGGRDGCACVSLLLYTDDDYALARELNRERLITVDKGLKRWKKMFNHREDLGGGLVSLDLRVQPAWVRQDSDANAAWNLRTIVLMARAGLLAIESKAPPSRQLVDEVEDEDQTSELFADYFNSATVRILSQRHLEQETWAERVNAARIRTKEFNKLNLELMEDVLQSRREMSELLASVYRIPEAGVEVTTACGGCPVCRAEGANTTSYVVPHAVPIRELAGDVDALLRGATRDFADFCVVSYEKPRNLRRWTRDLGRLVRRLVTMGICEVVASRELLGSKEFEGLYRHSSHGFLIYRGIAEQTPGYGSDWMLPRLTILEPTSSEQKFPRQLLEVDRPFHIVLAPDDLRDPVNPQRRYIDVSAHLTLDRFERRLKQ